MSVTSVSSEKQCYSKGVANNQAVGQLQQVTCPSLSQGGSVAHILKFKYPDGLDEVAIATIIKPALKALEYIHKQVSRLQTGLPAQRCAPQRLELEYARHHPSLFQERSVRWNTPLRRAL